MIERLVNGFVPKKHHLQLRDDTGHLHFEHCITQEGFDAPYTITYHREPPHRQVGAVTNHGWLSREAAPSRDLRKRHFLSQNLAPSPKSPLDARVPMFFNADVTLGIVKPTTEDTAYFNNGDGDDLFYIHQGGGTLRSLLGDLTLSIWLRPLTDDPGAELFLTIPLSARRARSRVLTPLPTMTLFPPNLPSVPGDLLLAHFMGGSL
jgi:hypothetical protein